MFLTRLPLTGPWRILLLIEAVVPKAGNMAVQTLSVGNWRAWANHSLPDLGDTDTPLRARVDAAACQCYRGARAKPWSDF